MNPLAEELNAVLKKKSPHVFSMLSSVGKHLFFPKGILSQSTEAKEKAYKFNATIGIATENNEPMSLSASLDSVNGISAKNFLTYASSFGIPDLRKKWSEQLFSKNPSLANKTISLPVVTCGITNGLSVCADMFIDPDDIIVAPEMMWGNYNMIFSVRRNAIFRHYPIFSENGGFNLKGFKEKIEEEAKQHEKITVLLNFPHNPTGYTVTEDEADSIADILCKTADSGAKIIALCDDSYFGLVYEKNIITESLFARLAGLRKNILTVKTDGVTKEEFAWGLRVGFVTYACKAKEEDSADIYEALERKTAGGIRGNISNASHLSQSIVLKTMNANGYEKEKKNKFEILKSRARKIKEVLDSPKYREGWDVYPFNSGYFMCIKLKGNSDSETVRKYILEKYGVGLISTGKKDLRVAFSCVEKDNIGELFDIVLEGVKECR